MVWILALSRVEVSVAYPMLSVGYVVNALAAWWLFGENLSGARLAGIGVIMLGVWLVARNVALRLEDREARIFYPLHVRRSTRRPSRAVAEVMRSGWITSGPQVREFEALLSAFAAAGRYA